MATKDDYLTGYREFFEHFAQTVNPNDQLPVKLGSYKLLNMEVVGGIIDWAMQYLSQKKCPPELFSPLIRIIIDETRKSCKKQPLDFGFNENDNAYEPLKLMQLVMAKTNEVCLRYLDNSMLCSLPAPSNTYKTSIFAARNKRRKMDDRHVALHDLNTLFNFQEASPSSYYAIFDGHAGHDAAAYSAAHLHQYLAEHKQFFSDPKQALTDAFHKTDELFLEKCRVENLRGGTTVVVALLRPKEKTLYIAWVGDSQALLVNNQGKTLQCVNPHKPCREDERQRIEQSGGFVALWGVWRVNGQLGVSRAIGDAHWKKQVISLPEVREISLDGDEDFLILASDGLWDYLSEVFVAQSVYLMLIKNPDDTDQVAQYLTQQARYKGSGDNISVIVVFLREPHQIVSDIRRRVANKEQVLITSNMEASLDNANNPFTNSNGSLKSLEMDSDNINLQTNNEGLLLNLADKFKANGADLSQEIFATEKANGTKKSVSDLHFDDDLGPETNVDAVDDTFSPIEKAFRDVLGEDLNDDGLAKSLNDKVKSLTEEVINNNPLDDGFNPFSNDRTEVDTEAAKELHLEQLRGANREETPEPPVDAVHDAGGLDVNPAESDSEDEWNYIKGDQAKPETSSSQPDTVAEPSELDDAMSQLNPNAAEFVPVSPTRSIPSPACRKLFDDQIISGSPKRAVKMDINLPSETEFESEVKSRPSDLDYKNGHGDENDHDSSGGDQIDNILNGKSIDEIPEFQPGSTPAKLPSEEFHFGPKSAPFTPRVLDQSEVLSTKANYGDDTERSFNMSFNESELLAPSKEQSDPMSMSFYAEKGKTNPFQDSDDLNEVHELPENLDTFLQEEAGNKENQQPADVVMSDLSEYTPLESTLDNDQAAIQITDLDKISQDDEKELASPLEDHNELLDISPAVGAPLNDVECSFQNELLDDNSSFPQSEPVSHALQPASIPPSELDELSPSSPVPLNTTSPIQVEEHDLLPSQSPLPVQIESANSQEVIDDLLTTTTSQVPSEHLPVESPPIESQELVCESKQELKSSSPTLEESPVCEFNPKTEVENINIDISESKCGSTISPVPACEYSSDMGSSEVVQPDIHISESPIDLLQEAEITSSVKDDISSPIEQLSPAKSAESLIEEPAKSPDVLEAEVHHEFQSQEASSQDLLSGFSCPLPTSQLVSQPQEDEINLIETLASSETNPSVLSNGFDSLVTGFNEQICIKTDSIQPEFAEPAILTPSEEIKPVPVTSPAESESKVIIEKLSEEIIEPTVSQEEQPIEVSETPKESIVLAPLPLIPVTPLEVKETHTSDDKKAAPAATKKAMGTAERRKSTDAPKVGTVKPSPKPSAPKTGVAAKLPAKVGTVKSTASIPTKSTTSTTSASKPSPKPKTASPASKPTEKKPTTSADVKPAPRTLLAKKAPAEAPATKTITRPATATNAKPNLTKTSAPRPNTAPRTTTAPKPAATASAPKPAAAAKPRVPLSSRTGTTTAPSKPTTTTTAKTTTAAPRSVPSPKTSTAPAKPRTTASTAPKPRVPLTKTVTKSADLEKEKKESANKVTASRTTTVTKTTSGTATSRVTSTTVKKTEIKPLSNRTVASKTTTTTTSKTTALGAKKPSPIKAPSKTKTTKVEKPKENGVAPTSVTEEIKEITIINNVVNETDSENLLKDNSPVDNKLIIETSNSLIDDVNSAAD